MGIDDNVTQSKYLFIGGPKHKELVVLAQAYPYVEALVLEETKLEEIVDLRFLPSITTVRYKKEFFGIKDYGFYFYHLIDMPPHIVFEEVRFNIHLVLS